VNGGQAMTSTAFDSTTFDDSMAFGTGMFVKKMGHVVHSD